MGVLLACRIDSRHLSQIQKLLQRKTHCFLFSVLSRLIAAGNGFLTYLQMCTLVCSHAGPWGVSRASLSHRSVSICIVFPGHVPLGMPPCPFLLHTSLACLPRPRPVLATSIRKFSMFLITCPSLLHRQGSISPCLAPGTPFPKEEASGVLA